MRSATANLQRLRQIFTLPTDQLSTLFKIEEEISQNLLGFLRNNVVASDLRPIDLEKSFADYRVPCQPIFVSEQAEFLLQKVVSPAVNTSSPKFIGHMASALPYFMLPLTKIMTALNQNLVKTETSKSFTPLERQVLAMLHHLVYQREDQFYRLFMHNSKMAIGAFCSGGTIANITALWVARNRLFASKTDSSFAGVNRTGMSAALRFYGYRDAAIVVSRLGHYSLAKASDLLGIGRDQLIAIDTDCHQRVRSKDVQTTIAKLRKQKIAIIALVGLAGSTETGSIDPLSELAKIAADNDCHFHVDGSWGGPTLFSQRHAKLLEGIANADSVTLDAHKQLYVPMGAGMVLFKDQTSLNSIEHHANYIIRENSRDLGKHTLEGSRPGMALLVHSALRIFGQQGFELLIDHGLNSAQQFAELIDQADNFELITKPQLNVLTYRFHPPDKIPADDSHHQFLNRLTTNLQRRQRERGKSFVSRTTLTISNYRAPIVVLRAVLANPLTSTTDLQEILQEQEEIGFALLNELPTDTRKGAAC